MSLETPWPLLLLPLALIPLLGGGCAGQAYSSLMLVPRDRLSELLALALRGIAALAAGLLVLALCGPERQGGRIERVGKGAQLVLAIDRSASMDDPFAGGASPQRAGESKSAAARRLITRFVQLRRDDMVGVAGFSNSALHAVPLTHQREAVFAAIEAATGSGLLQTNIGAGLTRAVAMFEGQPDSGSRAIVLLSDGAGRISPQVRNKLADWLVRERVNLYWIVLRQPGGISIFDPQPPRDDQGREPAEIELHKFLQTLGTRYRAYEAEDPGSLQRAIEDIDARERHPIRYSEQLPGRDLSGWMAGSAALLILLLAAVRHWGMGTWPPARDA